MIRGLAIETSGREGSVALAEDGQAIADDHFPHGLKHAAELLPMIDRLCQARGWKPADIAEIYVSIGPGSFTGLRVGVTIAKTLAFVTRARLVGVPTVEALAENAPKEAREVIVVLDAKRDQIFTARLARLDENTPWRVAEAARLDTLAAMLERSPRPVHLIGEGIPYHQKFISTDPGVIVTSTERWRARATAVAPLGFAMGREGHFTDPLRLTPLYIRLPEAEEKWEAAHAAASKA